MMTKLEPGARLAWLEIARQQSQALAKLRAAQPPLPLRWDEAVQAPARHRPLRPAWLTAGLAVLVLGAATGTLAYMHHRREHAAHTVPTVVPLGKPAARPTVVEKRPVQRRVAPAPQPAPKPVAKRAVRRSAVAARPKEQPAEETRPETPPGTVIFNPEEPGAGGSIIIVNPPRRLPPIFTTEQYKKQPRLRW